MLRRALRRIVFVLLIAALLAPVLEAFDTWDSIPGLADDTEFNLAALAVAAGLFVAVALVAVLAFAAGSERLSPRLKRTASVSCAQALLPFFTGASPPGLPLRI
jgi:hypothetical protein